MDSTENTHPWCGRTMCTRCATPPTQAEREAAEAADNEWAARYDAVQRQAHAEYRARLLADNEATPCSLCGETSGDVSSELNGAPVHEACAVDYEYDAVADAGIGA